jgi:hypothetical protein
MFAGEPTAEMKLAERNPELMDRAAALGRESENEYLGLLKLNPCIALKTLSLDYSDDLRMCDWVKARIQPC